MFTKVQDTKDSLSVFNPEPGLRFKWWRTPEDSKTKDIFNHKIEA